MGAPARKADAEGVMKAVPGKRMSTWRLFAMQSVMQYVICKLL